MIDHIIVTHHIQKHILSVLLYSRVARFRDLRPPRTDTNLFSYHLKLLLTQGFIEKCDGGYTLSQHGLAYVDRISTEKFTVRSQPKIITMLLIQNSDGDILLQKRSKQPYIDSWTLPYGKLHIDDSSVAAAARREATEKLALVSDELRHVGDAYIRVRTKSDFVLSTTLAHVFRVETDSVQVGEGLMWVSPRAIFDLALAPAVLAITGRAFFGDAYFFEEFDETWDLL